MDDFIIESSRAWLDAFGLDASLLIFALHLSALTPHPEIGTPVMCGECGVKAV
jgi:hypothetical protein